MSLERYLRHRFLLGIRIFACSKSSNESFIAAAGAEFGASIWFLLRLFKDGKMGTSLLLSLRGIIWKCLHETSTH